RNVFHLQSEITGDFAERYTVLVIVAQQHPNQRTSKVADCLYRHIASHLSIGRLLFLALSRDEIFGDVLRALMAIEINGGPIERQYASQQCFPAYVELPRQVANCIVAPTG